MFETVGSSEVRICALAKMRDEVCISPDLGNRNNISQALSTQAQSSLENVKLSCWIPLSACLWDNIKTLHITQKAISLRPSLVGLAQGSHDETKLCNGVS